MADEDLGSTAAWQRLNSTTAMFLNCRVLYCNRVGYEDGVNFWGGSETVGPNGVMTARAKILEEDFLVVEIEEGALRRERIFSPLMRDESLSITLRELQRIEHERSRLCRSLV